MPTRWVQTPQRRRTKLIASVDAVSCTEATITRLIGAGMNLVHLEEGGVGAGAIESAYAIVRAAAHEVRTPVGIMVDIDGAAGDEQGDRVRSLAELGVDFLAVRCVRDVRGVEQMRRHLPGDSLVLLLAAIEHADVLAEAEALAAVADGLIVAVDGPDSGMDAEDVPVVQRHLVAVARSARKPCVITADPTLGVAGGADAMLLVNEGTDTAEAESIEMADGMARRLEADLVADAGSGVASAASEGEDEPLPRAEMAIIHAAVGIAAQRSARAIIVLPSPGSGMAARALSSEHPPVPIVACALSVAAMTKMSILGGVIPRFIPPGSPTDGDELARTITGQLSLAEEGEAVVTVEGIAEGGTPRVSVVTV
jgi:pyruvate kinase